MAGAAPTSKPAPFYKPLDTLDRGLLLAETALSLVIVLLMVLVAVTESASRLMPWLQRREFLRPVLRYSSDLLMHGTIWAAFLGASFATRHRKHLAIDALSRVLPQRWRRAVVALSTTLGAFVALTLAKGILVALTHQAHQAHEAELDNIRNHITSNVDRAFEFQYILPVGFALIGIRLLMHSFHELIASFCDYQAPVTPPPPSATQPFRDGDPSPESASSSPTPARVLAPVMSATAAEIGIAIVALVGLVVATRGTTVFVPALFFSVLAALTLGVPLLVRWRVKGNLEPDDREDTPRLPFNFVHVVVSLAAVACVLAAMKYGVGDRLQRFSVPVGVAFFAVMAIIGAPLFTFLGGLGLFLFMHGGRDVAAQSLANSVEDVLGNHFGRMSVLTTIPLFTLAGYLMSESRMPQRLVRVSRAWLGWMPGGLAVVCVFASMFFTVFSGASGITIVAVGGLLLPTLLRDNYPERFSMGLVTTGGALGITIPPALPLIVYGIVAGLQEAPPGHERLELQKFLLAGIVPGFVAVGVMVVYAIIMGYVSKVPRSKFDAKEAGASLWEGKWELALPFVLLIGLAKGIFNPSQAAAFTAFYVLVIEVFVYRDLTVRHDLPRIVPESMVLVGAIFVKLCAATVLVGYFVQAQTADRLFEWLTCGTPARQYMHLHADVIGTCREAVDALARHNQGAGGIIDSKLSFLIALNIFLLIVGMLMDIFSAIVVVVPLIAGIAMHFHINPYHLGIVFLINLEIGYLMPPMGLNLFIAGFRFNRPVPELYRTVLPFIGLFVFALMVITYVPSLTLMFVPGQHGDRPAATAGAGPAGGGGALTDGGVGEGGAGLPTTNDGCTEPREGESFEDFDRRCSVSGGGAANDPNAGSSDASAVPGTDAGAVPQSAGDASAAGAISNSDASAGAIDGGRG